MTIFYRILSVDDKEHTFGVRYWSDKISEKELRMDERDEHDPPIRCRTDYNLTAWNVEMTSDEIHDYIVSCAPTDWFNLKAAAKDTETTAMQSVKTLVGTNKEATLLRLSQAYILQIPKLKNIIQNTKIETENFICHPISTTAVDNKWLTWMNDNEIVRIQDFGHTDIFKTVDELISWLKPYETEGCIIGIFDKKTNVIIGFTMFKFDYSINECISNSLYIGEPSYRHKGTYSEVRGPLANFVFGDLQMNKITAHVVDKNDFFITTLLKRGWQKEEATLKKQLDGSDLVLYKLTRTREDWLNKEGKDYKAT